MRPQKLAPKTVLFGQIGEIMSNLVTLVALYRRDDFDIYKSLFVSKE